MVRPFWEDDALGQVQQAKLWGAAEGMLKVALPKIAFTGWHGLSLPDVALEAGQPRVMLDRCFPNGCADMVAFFGAWVDAEVRKSVAEMPWDELRVTAKVTEALWWRFEAMEPYREAVRQLLMYYAMPGHLGEGLERLYQTVDMIWYLAGDQATDWNYYSKRLLLAGVYSTTLQYWLEDDSAGQLETRRFLEARIANVLKLPKLKAECKKKVERVFSVVTGRRMAA